MNLQSPFGRLFARNNKSSSARRSRKSPRHKAFRTALRLEPLEERKLLAVLDLFTPGASGILNDATFQEVIGGGSSGSGVYNTFVQIQAGTNDFDSNSNTEQGVNYDRSGALGPTQSAQYDENNSGPHNRFLDLSEVPIIEIGNQLFREINLDINQLNNRPYLSLDSLMVSVADSGNLQQSPAPTPPALDYDPTFGGSATLVYDMDGGPEGDNTLRMLSDNILDNGSGKGDVSVLIPNSQFADAIRDNEYTTPFVYLFSAFGFTDPAAEGDSVPVDTEFYTNDGFEEWATETPTPAPLIHMLKSTTYDDQVGDGLGIPEGSDIGWVYEVTNIGTFPLSNITVTDDQGVTPVFESGDINDNNILDIGETWIYTATGTAISAHLGTYNNIGTATGDHFPEESPMETITDSDPSSYTPTDVAPTLIVDKTGPASIEANVDMGVTYTVTITTTSDIIDPLTITSIDDDVSGNLLAIAVAQNGGSPIILDTDPSTATPDSFTFTFTDTLNLDIDEEHTNVVTVIGEDDEESEATDDDDHTVTGEDQLPEINLVKQVDPDSVREGGVGGDQVTYTYTLTNTSPSGIFDPLSDVTLTDTDGTPVFVSGDDGDDLLEVGEIWVYTLTITPPPQNAGTTHTNTAEVTGKDDEDNTASDEDTATITYDDVLPAIQVLKSADPTSVPEGGVGSQSVTYTYLVTNTSDAGVADPLSGVTLTDTDGTPVFQSGDDGDGLLEVGEIWVYTLTVTPPAQNAGTTHTNTATATGTDDENNTATDDDSETIDYTDVLPAIDILKEADLDIVPVPGGMVTYTFTITNTSDASTDPLEITSLIDDAGDGFDGLPPGGNDIDLLPAAEAAFVADGGTLVDQNGDLDPGIVLAAGESFSFGFTLTFTIADLGPYTNTVTVVGVDDEDNETTATDDETITIIKPSELTNTSYCSFDFDPDLPGSQFRLLYVMESGAEYRLNASNPGQFYYNVFVPGTPGEATVVDIDIPFPFVTQGAVSIHVYDSFDIEAIIMPDGSDGQCYTPIGDVTGDFTIDTQSGSTSANGSEIIVLDDYSPQDIGSTQSITVSGNIPDTGWMYVTVHLDYDLKRTSGWTRDPADPETAVNAGLGVTLAEPQNYDFAFAAGLLGDSETGQSVNNFKKGQGALVMVTDESDSPVSNVQVEMYDPMGGLIDSQITDEDGWLYFQYKHKGKAATYTVSLPDYDLEQSFTLKANRFVLLDFQVSTLAAAADQALLAWLESESSDSDETDDLLTSQMADELAMMLVE